MRFPARFAVWALLLTATTISTIRGQSTTTAVTSMGSYGPVVAPDSIAAVWGTGLANATAVSIKDSAGATTTATLYMVSAGQISFVVPANAALGQGTLTVTGGSGAITSAKIQISNVAPSIFTANADGQGVPAAQLLRVRADGTFAYEAPFTGSMVGAYTASPINLNSPSDKLYLILYGSGIRRHSANPVIVTINNVSIPVLYAGAQTQFAGLDQVNIGPLPASLAGAGTVTLSIIVDGVPSNPVQLAFK